MTRSSSSARVCRFPWSRYRATWSSSTGRKPSLCARARCVMIVNQERWCDPRQQSIIVPITSWLPPPTPAASCLPRPARHPRTLPSTMPSSLARASGRQMEPERAWPQVRSCRWSVVAWSRKWGYRQETTSVSPLEVSTVLVSHTHLWRSTCMAPPTQTVPPVFIPGMHPPIPVASRA